MVSSMGEAASYIPRADLRALSLIIVKQVRGEKFPKNFLRFATTVQRRTKKGFKANCPEPLLSPGGAEAPASVFTTQTYEKNIPVNPLPVKSHEDIS
jgi:hypothetical protein